MFGEVCRFLERTLHGGSFLRLERFLLSIRPTLPILSNLHFPMPWSPDFPFLRHILLFLLSNVLSRRLLFLRRWRFSGRAKESGLSGSPREIRVFRAKRENNSGSGKESGVGSAERFP